MRGLLKHSWLENQILHKTPEEVVGLRRGKGWPALRGFPADVERALAFAAKIEFAFSPARLVDICAPLTALPEDQRSAIRTAVHAAYLKYFDAHGVAQRLRDAANQLMETILALLDEWNQPDEAISDSELQTRWCAVYREAEHLWAVLDALPKGVVLP